MAAWKKTLSAAAIASSLLLFGCGDGARSGMSDSEPPAPPASDQTASAFTADATNDAEVTVDNGQKGETVGVRLVSWRDLPFQTVKHQAYDYSCGSAAVATLVTYIYGIPTSEKDVFQEMFTHGDQNKIRHEGFSMLDMSRYLNDHGLEAKGYKITASAIENYRMPFIALVNNKGYNHFVVVKTMDHGRVLVGDPNTGNTEYTQAGFARIWNGLALIIVNHASKAREAFGNQKEWRFVRAHAPVHDGSDNGNDLGTEVSQLPPMSWQIAPVVPSILPAAMIGTVGTVATSAVGGGS
jgi:predicted double-glycine peptidase